MEGRAPILPSILCTSSASRSLSEQKRFYLTVELLEPSRYLAMYVPTLEPELARVEQLSIQIGIRTTTLRNHFQCYKLDALL